MKFSTLFVAITVGAVTAILAVANRQEVVFKLDPFAANDSAVAFVMPLFLLVFLSFVFGVMVGAATIALRRGRNARKKRLADSESLEDLATRNGDSAMPPKT
jgi:ABC-type Na+ efflux pump permease subunit